MLTNPIDYSNDMFQLYANPQNPAYGDIRTSFFPTQMNTGPRPVQSAPTSGASTGMFGDPFGTAMSGMKSGTLQPYVNRMTQDANKALYGGLLNYQPSPIIAGDAGGTPVDSTPPQGFDLQSALLNGEFGKRSWMK
jgi:hypothetical protein